MKRQQGSKLKKLFLSALVLAFVWAAPRMREHLAGFLGTASGENTPADVERATTSRAPEKAQGSPEEGLDANAREGAATIREAFLAERSGFMVTSAATVTKSLPDDRDGSQHQRFIVELPNAHTVLVAHNIDLAPRVPLEEGDAIVFKGQYEWNERGGVIHWTHGDPAGWHEEGWIRHAGKDYQ